MSKVLTIATAALGTLQPGHHEPGHAWQAHLLTLAQDDARFAVTLTAPLNLDLHNMYAGHSSHRSHSSHSSHRSHYSGSGGYSAPVYTPPPPPPPPRPTTYAPVSSGSSATSGDPFSLSAATVGNSQPPRASQDQLQLMIMRVQAALFARGYDPGGIDGTLGPQTRMALELFQSRHGMPVTGTMTTETLDALGIALSP